MPHDEPPTGQQPPGYDPYDVDHRPGRRRAGPRLVDLSQPIDRGDDRPAVFRPYAPQPTLRPEQVVPPDDNPLRGWRWLGVSMLTRTLWPRDAATNPMIAYYSGRRRGRRTEDYIGLLPWLVLIGLDAAIFLGAPFSVSEFALYGLATFIPVFILGVVVSMAMSAMHLRRIVRGLPFDELLLTRLKPIDIVQGMSIRPIAIQAFGVFLYTFAQAGLFAIAELMTTGAVTLWSAVYAVFVCLLRWYWLGFAVEYGGALAVRAHLCMRSSMQATLRMLIDFALTLMVMFVMLMAAAFFAWLFACCLSAFGNFVPGVPVQEVLTIIFGIFMVMFLTFIAAETLKGGTAEAMSFAYHYPEEWWINFDPERAEQSESSRRSLFTPWKQVSEGRRIFTHRTIFNRQFDEDKERAPEYPEPMVDNPYKHLPGGRGGDPEA